MKKIVLSLLTVFMVLSLSVVLVKADVTTTVSLEESIYDTDISVSVLFKHSSHHHVSAMCVDAQALSAQTRREFSSIGNDPSRKSASAA